MFVFLPQQILFEKNVKISKNHFELRKKNSNIRISPTFYGQLLRQFHSAKKKLQTQTVRTLKSVQNTFVQKRCLWNIDMIRKGHHVKPP